MTGKMAATASWGPRPESAEACAGRLFGTLHDIPVVGDGAQQWSYIGKGPGSTSGKILPFDGTEEDLATIVEAAAMRNDRGELMPNGGFAPTFSRLSEKSRRDYSIFCGVNSPHLNNNVALMLPPASQSSTLTEPDALLRTLEALVQGWQPDHATIISHPFRKAQGHKPGRGQIPVGWLTFLSSSLAMDRDRLESLAAVREADDGLYLTLPGNPTDPDLDAATQIRHLLGMKDLLERLQAPEPAADHRGGHSCQNGIRPPALPWTHHAPSDQAFSFITAPFDPPPFVPSCDTLVTPSRIRTFTTVHPKILPINMIRFQCTSDSNSDDLSCASAEPEDGRNRCTTEMEVQYPIRYLQERIGGT